MGSSISGTSKTGWDKVMDILKIVVPLLLGAGVIWRIADSYVARQPPTFAISAINTLGERNVYEVTNNIIDSSPADPITMTWGLQVIPTYRGSTSYGEVRVLVKNKQGFVLAQGQWDNFDKDSNTLSIPLDPYALAPEVGWIDSGLRENIFAGGKFSFPEAILKIEIAQASRLDSPLVTDTFILRNSPWYHYTTCSAWHDGSVDVYVYGKNLGGASDFSIVCAVLEIRELPGEAWDNWPEVDSKRTLISDVKSGQEFTATVSFPTTDEFQFEHGKVYYIETFVAKKQNYLQFRDGPWQFSDDIWRLGSFGTWELVIP